MKNAQLFALLIVLIVLVVLAFVAFRKNGLSRERGLFQPAKAARAIIRGDPGVAGVVEFHEPVPGAGTRVSARISGLAPGLHGFHVHEKGDTSNRCEGAGPHYNPEGHQHGAPGTTARHVGDLGNIAADSRGVAARDAVDPQLSLQGPHSVLGRTLVVHRDPDDFGLRGTPVSLTTGNSGPRVGCGLILPV